MPLAVLDIIVIVVVLISAVLAMVRGFVREVLSVASWVVAAGAAYLLYKPLVPVVKPYIQNDTVAVIVAAAAIFFVALIVASYITMRISDFVIDSKVGALDRALGFVFGAARGLLLVVIALLFFEWLVAKPPSWVAEARTRPMLESLGSKLQAALPQDLEASVIKRFRRGGAASGDTSPTTDTTTTTPAPSGTDAASPDAKYGNGERQRLDQLIQNSGDGNGN